MIPAFTSQILIDTDSDGVQVTTGTAQTLADDHFYYLVSDEPTAVDGQSLLEAIKLAAEASLGGTTWTLWLHTDGSGRVRISHNNGSSRTLTLDTVLATMLGFTSGTIVVAAATTVTSTYPSAWWWSPEQPISEVNGGGWDPAEAAGVPFITGHAHRSPDGTVGYLTNGELKDCTLIFRAVEPYELVRDKAGYTNESLETWWRNGPAKGRKFLWWRDRDDATGDSSPSTSDGQYIVLAPSAELMTKFPAVPLPGSELLNHWDVTLEAWLTELGEDPI